MLNLCGGLVGGNTCLTSLLGFYSVPLSGSLNSVISNYLFIWSYQSVSQAVEKVTDMDKYGRQVTDRDKYGRQVTDRDNYGLQVTDMVKYGRQVTDRDKYGRQVTKLCCLLSLNLLR